MLPRTRPQFGLEHGRLHTGGMGDEDDGSEGVAAAAAAAAAAQAAAAAAAAATVAIAAADAVCPRMQSPSRPESCE